MNILFNYISRKGFCKIFEAKIVIISVSYVHAYIRTHTRFHFRQSVHYIGIGYKTHHNNKSD